MSFLRHIIGLIPAMLVTALSVVAMPMAPEISHQADFLRHQQALIAEHTRVHCTARAPPIAAANIAVTGATVAEQGSGIFMHGYETHVASLGFGVGLDAPNRTFDFTSSGTGNDLRRFTTLDGTDVRINSGHAYNRPHAGGDVSQIGTMDEIDTPFFAMFRQILGWEAHNHARHKPIQCR